MLKQEYPDTDEGMAGKYLLGPAANKFWSPERFAFEFAFEGMDAANGLDIGVIKHKAEIIKGLGAALPAPEIMSLTQPDLGRTRELIASNESYKNKPAEFQRYTLSNFAVNAAHFMHHVYTPDLTSEQLALLLAKGALASTDWSSANDRIPVVRLFDGLAEAFADPRLHRAMDSAIHTAERRIPFRLEQQRIAKEKQDEVDAFQQKIDQWKEKYFAGDVGQQDNLRIRAYYIINWAKTVLRSDPAKDVFAENNIPPHAPESVRTAINELREIAEPSLALLHENRGAALDYLSQMVLNTDFYRSHQFRMGAEMRSRLSSAAPELP